jgi:hypothetical protein
MDEIPKLSHEKLNIYQNSIEFQALATQNTSCRNYVLKKLAAKGKGVAEDQDQDQDQAKGKA